MDERTTKVHSSHDGRQGADASVVRPFEDAQLVWQHAIVLAGSHQSPNELGAVLDLLRAADHSPSTMHHALGLGQAQQRATPDDLPTRDAVLLLRHTIVWLGSPLEPDEVGSAVGTRR